MIKSSRKLKKFNRDSLAQEDFTYREALRIFEGLYQEARNLGVINSQDILEGLEVNLKIAKALHQLSQCSKRSSRN